MRVLLLAVLCGVSSAVAQEETVPRLAAAQTSDKPTTGANHG